MRKEKAKTAICYFDADSVKVRGRDLVDDIIGRMPFTQYFLLQALGETPRDAQVAIVDTVMTTIMEHGLVPSAVTTRLTYYGAPESYQGAIAAGLLGVGDRYAGTAGECGAILERIVERPEDERENAALEEVRAYRKLRRPLPGFGHPIHREEDRRVDRLLGVVEQQDIDGHHLAALNLLEQALQQEVGKNLVTNISAAIGASLGEAGIPCAMMRGIVLTARCAGLVGHLNEEMQEPAAHAMWVGAQDAVDFSE